MSVKHVLHAKTAIIKTFRGASFSDGYHFDWLFRCLMLAALHEHGVKVSLHYGMADSPSHDTAQSANLKMGICSLGVPVIGEISPFPNQGLRLR